MQKCSVSEYRIAISMLNSKYRFYLNGFIQIPAWIRNYIHYKVWDEITNRLHRWINNE